MPTQAAAQRAPAKVSKWPGQSVRLTDRLTAPAVLLKLLAIGVSDRSSLLVVGSVVHPKQSFVGART